MFTTLILFALFASKLFKKRQHEAYQAVFPEEMVVRNQ